MKAEIPPLLYNKFFASPVCCWSKKHSWGQSLGWQKIGNHVASVAAGGGCWRLVGTRFAGVTPWRHTLPGGEGRSQRNKEMEMENAAAEQISLHPPASLHAIEIAFNGCQQQKRVKWWNGGLLFNSICGLHFQVFEKSCLWKEGLPAAHSARAKKYAIRDWTLLGGLSGVVGPGLLPRGGGGYCGYWRGRAGGLWLLTEPRHLVPSSTQTSQH